MDDNEAEKLKQLRQALVEGEESGEPMPFDFEAFIAQEFGDRKLSEKRHSRPRKKVQEPD